MIYSLQLLRFVAAFMILMAHIILFSNDKYGFNGEFLMPLTDILMIGVDIFFIISGFIMYHTSYSLSPQMSAPRSKEFLIKRFIRIYPVYWLLCIALLPIIFFMPSWINSGSDIPPSLLHSFLLLPHESVPLLMVAWTLEFEMFFYVCFGLTLLLGRQKQFIFLSAVFIALAVIGLSFPDLSKQSATLEMITSSMILYFPVGMMIAVLFNKIKESSILLIILFLIAWAASIFMAYNIKLGSMDRFLHFGIPAILSVLLFLSVERFVTKEKLKSFCLWGGNISYSLYLVHILVISVVGKIWLFLKPQTSNLPIEIMLTLMIIGSLVAATILYYGFEKPISKFLKKRLLPRHEK